MTFVFKTASTKYHNATWSVGKHWKLFKKGDLTEVNISEHTDTETRKTLEEIHGPTEERGCAFSSISTTVQERTGCIGVVCTE